MKRHAAEVGPRPGVTKHQSWIRLEGNMELLDTPGILWPRFDDQEIGMKLALVGSIKDELVGEYRMALFLLQYCVLHYPQPLQERYQLVDMAMEPLALLGEIAQKRGCVKSHQEIDLERAAKILLQDFRGGKLPGISLEFPMET